MKISVIIPVYNVEKYIKKCLETVKEQTYKDIEVIIVNDGTKDNSQNIINEFVEKDSRFKSFIKENGGLSDARNYGTQKATGDYIIYLDSDDFWDLDLLERLVEQIDSNKEIPDLIYFPKRIITENEKFIKQENVPNISMETGENVISILRNLHITFETAWCYLINREFWNKNSFQFEKGRLHEDIGIMPIVLVQAQKVSVVNNSFYNYVQREGSITNNTNYQNLLKRLNDLLYFYDVYQEKLTKLNVRNKTKKILEEYIASGVLQKACFLKEKEFKEYKEKIKNRKVLSKIYCTSFRSIIKRIYYILKLYLLC